MAYQLLLDAINNGKNGTKTTLEIKYSINDLTPLLVAHHKEKDSLVIENTVISVPLFNTEVRNAFFQWESVFSMIYGDYINLTFTKVDENPDIFIGFNKEQGSRVVTVSSNKVLLEVGKNWSSILSPTEYTILPYLTWGIGKFLGVTSTIKSSPLKYSNLKYNYVRKHNLKPNQDGSIDVSLLSLSSETIVAIKGVYGAKRADVLIYGCTNKFASNYNENATADDGSCDEVLLRKATRISPSARYRSNNYNAYFALNEDYYFEQTSTFLSYEHTDETDTPVSIIPTFSGTGATSIVINDPEDFSLRYIGLFEVSSQYNIFNSDSMYLSSETPLTSVDPNHVDIAKASHNIFYSYVSGRDSHILYVMDSSGAYRYIKLVDNLPQVSSEGLEISNCDSDTFQYGNQSYSASTSSVSFRNWPNLPIELNNVNATSAAELGSVYAQVPETDAEILAQDPNATKPLTTASVMAFGDGTEGYQFNILDNLVSFFDVQNPTTSDIYYNTTSEYSDADTLYSNYRLKKYYKEAPSFKSRRSFILPSMYGNIEMTFSLFTRYMKVYTAMDHSSEQQDRYYFYNSEYSNTTTDYYFRNDNDNLYAQNINCYLEMYLGSDETFGTLGMYNIFNNKYNLTSNFFNDVPDGYIIEEAKDIMFDLPSDDIKLYAALPVSIGNKLLQSTTFTTGTLNQVVIDDAVTAAGQGYTHLGNFHVAFALKHGFLLFKFHNANGRPDGSPLHVPGGNNSIITEHGGFTPVCMVFSPADNFLYTILQNPTDSTDKRIGIFQIQDGASPTGCIASSGDEIMNTCHIIDNPFTGELSKITLGEDGSIYIWSENSAEYCKITSPDILYSVQIFSQYSTVLTNTVATTYLPSSHKNLTASSVAGNIPSFGTAVIASNYKNSYSYASGWVNSGTGVEPLNSTSYNSNIIIGGNVYNLDTKTIVSTVSTEYVSNNTYYNTVSQSSDYIDGNLVLAADVTKDGGQNSLRILNNSGELLSTLSSEITDIPNAAFIIPISSQGYLNSFLIGHHVSPETLTNSGYEQYRINGHHVIGFNIWSFDYDDSLLDPYTYTNEGLGAFLPPTIIAGNTNNIPLPGVGICRFFAENVFNTNRFDLVQCFIDTSTDMISFSYIELDQNTSYSPSANSGGYNYNSTNTIAMNENVVAVHEHANANNVVISFSSDTTRMAIATNSDGSSAKTMISVFDYTDKTLVATVDVSTLLNDSSVEGYTSPTQVSLVSEYKVRSIEFSPSHNRLYVLIGVHLDDMTYDAEGNYTGIRSKLYRFDIVENNDGVSYIAPSINGGRVPEYSTGQPSPVRSVGNLFTSNMEEGFTDAGSEVLRGICNMTGLTTDIEGQIYVLNSFQYSSVETSLKSVIGFIGNPDAEYQGYVLSQTANVITEDCDLDICEESLKVGSITDTSQNTAYEDNVDDTHFDLDVQIYGCTDSNAWNYRPDATQDDGFCLYQAGPGVPVQRQLRSSRDPLLGGGDGADYEHCNDSIVCPVLRIRGKDVQAVQDFHDQPVSAYTYIVTGGPHAGSTLGTHIYSMSGQPRQNVGMTGSVPFNQGWPTHAMEVLENTVEGPSFIQPSPSDYTVAKYVEPTFMHQCCECLYQYTYELNYTTFLDNFNNNYMSILPVTKNFILRDHPGNFQGEDWALANPVAVLTNDSLEITLEELQTFNIDGVIHYAWSDDVLNLAMDMDLDPGDEEGDQITYQWDWITTGNLFYIGAPVAGVQEDAFDYSGYITNASLLAGLEFFGGDSSYELASYDPFHCFSCTDSVADNYIPPSECLMPICRPDLDSCIYLGCTDPNACNFDETANSDDGSCTYVQPASDGNVYCSCNNEVLQEFQDVRKCDCEGNMPNDFYGIGNDLSDGIIGNLVYEENVSVSPCDCDGNLYTLLQSDNSGGILNNLNYDNFSQADDDALFTSGLGYGLLLYSVIVAQNLGAANGFEHYTKNDWYNLAYAGPWLGSTGATCGNASPYYPDPTGEYSLLKSLAVGCGYNSEGAFTNLLPLPANVCNCNGDTSLSLYGGPYCDCDGGILDEEVYCDCESEIEFYYADPNQDGLISCPQNKIPVCPVKAGTEQTDTHGMTVGNYYSKDAPSIEITSTSLATEYTTYVNLVGCEVCTNEHLDTLEGVPCQCPETPAGGFFGNSANVQEVNCNDDCKYIVDAAGGEGGFYDLLDQDSVLFYYLENPNFEAYGVNECDQCVLAEAVDGPCCLGELDACGHCIPEWEATPYAIGNVQPDPNAEGLFTVSMTSNALHVESGTYLPYATFEKVCDPCSYLNPGEIAANFDYNLLLTSQTECDICLHIAGYIHHSGENNTQLEFNTDNFDTSIYTSLQELFYPNTDDTYMFPEAGVSTGYHSAQLSGYNFYICSCTEFENYMNYSISELDGAIGSGELYAPGSHSQYGAEGQCCPGYFYNKCAFNGAGGCLPVGHDISHLTVDCNGDCFGTAETDICGVCGGPGIVEPYCDCNQNVLDCAGTCGGTAVIDACGVCKGNIKDEADCAGCQDPMATNYNPVSIFDDGSCMYFTLYGNLDTLVANSASMVGSQATNMNNRGVLFDVEPFMDLNSILRNPKFYIEYSDILQDYVYRDQENFTFKCQEITRKDSVLKIENARQNAELIYQFSTNEESQSNIEEIIQDVTYQNIILHPENYPLGYFIPRYYFRIVDGYSLATNDPMILFADHLDKIESIIPTFGRAYQNSPQHSTTMLPDLILEGEVHKHFEEFSETGVTNNAQVNPNPNKKEAYMVYQVTPKKDENGIYYNFSVDFNNIVTQDDIDDALDPTDPIVDPVEEIPCHAVETIQGLRIETSFYGKPENSPRMVIYNNKGVLVENITYETKDYSVGTTHVTDLNYLDGCFYFIPIGFTKNNLWQKTKVRIMRECEVLHYLDYGASLSEYGTFKLHTDIIKPCSFGCEGQAGDVLKTDNCFATVKEDYKEFTELTLSLEPSSDPALLDSDNPVTADVSMSFKIIDLDTAQTYVQILNPEKSKPTVVKFSISKKTRLGVEINNPLLYPFKYELISEFGETIMNKKYR